MRINKTQMSGGLTDAFGLSDMVMLSHQFKVQIDYAAFDLGSWSKVSGLSVNWAPCTYRAGEAKDSYDAIVFPGNAKYGTIKLSRGACRDSAIVQAWLAETATRHSTLSGEIRLVNALHMVVVSWRLNDFYPIGWSVDTLASDSSKSVIETLELAHSGFLPDPGPAPKVVL